MPADRESLSFLEIERSGVRLREMKAELDGIINALASLGGRDERVLQQCNALKLWKLGFLNEVNLIKSNSAALRMIGAMPAKMTVQEMPLHPANHDGLLPGARRWEECPEYDPSEDRKRAAANDHD